ncbi:MAG: hypothetical protein AB7K09_03865 [Planctomycetota bacterium]
MPRTTPTIPARASLTRISARLVAVLVAGLLFAAAACASTSTTSNNNTNSTTNTSGNADNATSNGGNGNAGSTNSNSGAMQSAAIKLTLARSVEDGFATPECVIHDEMLDLYLVSNIGTEASPANVDGDGYISRVGMDGTMMQQKFIDGAAEGVTLNAPKGMAITGDTLWVADIDVVRRFDHTTGKTIDEIAVPGATFLSGVAADGQGGIFVCDSGTKLAGSAIVQSGSDAIHRIAADGTVSTFVKDRELNGPSAVLVAGNEVLVVSYRAPEMRRYKMDGKLAGMIKLPKGSLKGIVPDGRGGLLITSLDGECIYCVPDRTGDKVEIALGDLGSPGNLCFDKTHARILLPNYFGNILDIYEVSK